MLGPEDLKKQQQQEEVKPEVQPTTDNIPAPSVINEVIAVNRVAEILGDDKAGEHKRELAKIVEWATKQKGVTNLDDLAYEIRDLARRLGRGFDLEPMVKKMYRYVYLQNERASIDQEIGKLGG